MVRFLLTFVTVAMLSACSTEDLSYELSENGCSTGKQSFDSKDALCEGLRSNSRNNGAFCAYTLRKQKFESECGATFSTTN